MPPSADSREVAIVDVRRLATVRPTAAAAALAGLVALVHYIAVSAYTVDDAAISFAYASALADGLPPGIVTPGEPIAEGYSNPTWTVMLALVATRACPSMRRPSCSAACSASPAR